MGWCSRTLQCIVYHVSYIIYRKSAMRVIANNRKGQNSNGHFYRDRMNTADQSDYRFLNLSSILPAIPPDIRNYHFNLSLSYRFPIAIAASQYQTPDHWEAAIAIAECYRDENPLPIVSHHFPIAKSVVLNMEAITFLSRDPVWTGSEQSLLQTNIPQLLPVKRSLLISNPGLGIEPCLG